MNIEPALSSITATILAIIVSALATFMLWRAADRLPHASPNARSMHDRPTPRVGGLAIWAGFVPVALISPSPVPGGHGWMLAFAAIALVSLQDDWRGVPALARLVVHVAAALAVALAIIAPGGDPGPADAVLVGTVSLGIVWSANLFNFMDGSDGLAATAAFCGFAAYGAAAALAGAAPAAFFALAGAILPFLAVNAPPARTFMGDVGSVPLGFLAGAFGIAGVVLERWPAWFPLLVFLPFVADATVTLVRRLLRGERVSEPHRSHYYQRLNRLGAGHRGTLALYAALSLAVCATALGVLALAPGYGWAVLFTWIGLLAAIFAGIDYHWSRFTRASP
jgi:phospho-N-acetylmuramoyl-pentapeptide-transferase